MCQQTVKLFMPPGQEGLPGATPVGYFREFPLNLINCKSPLMQNISIRPVLDRRTIIFAFA